MKINVAAPSYGTQKAFEIDDEKKLVHLHDLRISQDFDAGILGEQFKGYRFKIQGGSDKQGFPMRQGILTNSRVRLLLKRGTVGYQRHRGKKGERRRKSVRGAIVAHDIGLLNCIIVAEGPTPLEGVTDHSVPRKLGPKRANKIRKLFNLTKEDDVRNFVIRHKLPTKNGKTKTRAPKIQRLLTPITEERKRRKMAMLKKRWAKAREEREAYSHLRRRRRQLQYQRKRARILLRMAGLRKFELIELRKEKQKEERLEKIRIKKEEKEKAAAAAAKAKSKQKSGSKKEEPKKAAKPEPKKGAKPEPKKAEQAEKKSDKEPKKAAKPEAPTVEKKAEEKKPEAKKAPKAEPKAAKAKEQPKPKPKKK
eukprot:NODE_2266_length_1228_cov_1074.066303_g1748_i1.p1 GENE.NODE_2266_length_1228_cov_1074.066303_g1748_i1~~NODE_2266_length_1228_cov_1074.066303_g1748_i1.p1  ORF type:complete len:385 (-),score=88.59 NODE_2266_length_1228_cov_1074.066303_g1748_i1:73-1167(-)